MGQYWIPVNLDKKEYLHAHEMGDGLKLLEQAWSTGGVATALVMLLAPLPVRRGGGDPSNCEGRGRWAGDRIVFVGDYSEPTDVTGIENFGALYMHVQDSPDCKNISAFAKRMVEANT